VAVEKRYDDGVAPAQVGGGEELPAAQVGGGEEVRQRRSCAVGRWRRRGGAAAGERRSGCAGRRRQRHSCVGQRLSCSCSTGKKGIRTLRMRR
jgi:hypothetical protein